MTEKTLQGPIREMYHAGKVDIPHEGEIVSRAGTHLYAAIDAFNLQSALAGDPSLMTSMLEVGGEVLEGLRGMVRSLDNCSVAIIATANDFVKHDERAREDLKTLGGRMPSAPPRHTAPPELTDPGAPGAPNPNPAPTRIGRGDLQPHPEDDAPLPSTPDPVDPDQDRREREEIERRERRTNPLPEPGSVSR